MFDASAQAPVIKPNWYNLDLAKDGVMGISIDKAYAELLRGRVAKPVIVAIIDGGLDLNHEDLVGKIWVNKREIPGNGKDDDKNGYIDDINGWNFLGSSKGSFEFANDQLVNDVRELGKLFLGKDSTGIPQAELAAYRTYVRKRADLETRIAKLNVEVQNTRAFLADVALVLKKMAKESPSLSDFKAFVPSSAAEAKAQNFMVSVLKLNPDFEGYMARSNAQLKDKENELNYRLNIDYDPRVAAAEEYARERLYGNPDVAGPVPAAHGTHVAGIIGALRGNGIGIDGVAGPVLLMPIRTIPDGDSREKDVANAIRYAADNGASIINMSFGFSAVSADKEMVIAAVKHAISKGVLFVQAAGNGGEDMDGGVGYPNRKDTKDDYFTKAFIKVSASAFLDDGNLKVPFSNFGKTTVDVFAPGLAINSTIPGNTYEMHSGTSMAAPVVSGLAAVIRAYFPKLSAAQVKQAIVGTVVKREVLAKFCITGGVVNAYGALQLAAKLTGQ